MGEIFQKLSAPNGVQSIDIEAHSYRAMYTSTQGLYTHDCSGLGPLFRKLSSGQSRGQLCCPLGQVVRNSRPGHSGHIHRLLPGEWTLIDGELTGYLHSIDLDTTFICPTSPRKTMILEKYFLGKCDLRSDLRHPHGHYWYLAGDIVHLPSTNRVV